MNKIITLFAIIVLTATFTLSQTAGKSDIKMQVQYGSENPEVMGIMNFEEIKLFKMQFTGEDLKGKHFEIGVKEIVNGKITKSEVAYTSSEAEQFRIEENKLTFFFFAKQTLANTARFDFQFSYGRKPLEYKIAATDKEFTAKTFLGEQKEVSIPLNTATYILAFLMPTIHKDGSTSYCEVVQSEIKPEDLGTKFNIPRYYLFDIKFHK